MFIVQGFCVCYFDGLWIFVVGFLLVVFVVSFWCPSNCSSPFAQACFIFLCINEMFVVGGWFGMNPSFFFRATIGY